MPQNTLRPAYISRNCFKTTRWKGSWPSHQRNSLKRARPGWLRYSIKTGFSRTKPPPSVGATSQMLPNLPSMALSIRLSKLQLLWPVYWCLLAFWLLFRFMSIPEIRFFFLFFFFFPFLFFGEASSGIEANLTVPRNTFVRPWVAPDPLFCPCVLSLSFIFRATRRPFTTRPTQSLSLSPRNSIVSKPSMTLAQLSYVWQQRGFASCAAAVSPFSSSLGFSFLIW